MQISDLKARVEAVLFSSDTALSAAKLEQILEVEAEQLRVALQQLQHECQQEGRGVILQEVAGGFQLRTRPEYAHWVMQLRRTRHMNLSRAATETLAIIAYRQPVTRAEIEGLRGVDSGGIARTLLEKDLVRVAGKKDAPGRPLLYATSARFLEIFGLNSLDDLPTLRDLKIDELERDREVELEMDFESQEGVKIE
ncbi:MAG: SMC-Scp complex subunit ScpB [Desulfuromonadaceae bacterium]|nr:SMC-Scp complex subunit ScpB [Desulfuromonadaceae bacterium]